MARQFAGLSYWDAQDRNSQRFKYFNNEEKKELRSKGYKNRGWDNVINSWNILQTVQHDNDNTISLSAYVAKKAIKEVEKAELSGNLYAVLDSLKRLIDTPDPEWEALRAIASEN
ncbi:hypothetical protein [Pleurocapsa sp. PCC 7319]|uniref:hypothetical protein n=1 Tax=Pleurocapsa sp. PCC 7319 TaxID=118161 RepID=UPI00034BDDC3|nr:hypothetical protein [Pleurocapsa sp. PCC 7319]